MPSSVNSKMRRYNSAGSLNTSGGYHFSAASHGINVDDHGNSNSNHHRRGSSTDSMDSSSYLGNHSRQSSDSASVDIPTRTLKTQRKVSSTTLDPLQFVKSKPADVLAKTAQEQIEAAKETRLSRVVIPEKEDVDWQSTADDLGDWQSNLSSWKHRRRRASAATYQRVEEVDSLEQEEEDKKKPKTYGEMMADRKKRMSTGALNFYPLDDNDDDLLGPKKSDPVEETMQKKELVRQETAPSIRLQQRLSLKNRANSVGSEKPSYEVKEIADWAKDDDDENNEKESTDDKQEEKSVAEQTSAPRNTHDDKFNRGKVSDSSKPSTSDSSSKTHSKPDNLTAKKSDDNKSSSVNKISNILKSFEKKEEVDYEKPKKKFEFSVEAGRTRSKWQEREKKESVDTPPVKLSDRPRAKSHPAKDFTEKNIKINLQKPHNTTKGFGFSISGGVEKKQPITVYKVNIGSAADVCDLQMKDIILSVNRKDVANMTQPQVQHIIDMAAKQGHVELKIKREMGEDDDLEDETFEEEEETTSPQNHSTIWKSPALEPRTHSPKTSTSPATSPSYHSRHREKSPPSHHRPSPDHHRHTDNHTHKKRSTPDRHTHTERSDHHIDTHRSALDRHTEKKPDHDRHNDRSMHEHSRRAEKTESSPSYYQRHRDTGPTANSQKSDKVPPPVPAKKTSTHREEVKLEVSVSSRKWEPQPQGQSVEEPKPVANTTADDEPMWIMDKLRAEHEPVKHAPISDTKQPETNNNDVKQESESESESEEEDEEESPISPAVREERSPLIETEVVQRPTITVRKNRELEVETPVVAHSFHVQESLPPPPPSEAPPPLRRSNLDEEGFKPPDILKRWQRSTRSGRSSSSNSLDSDADKRLSSSSLHAEFNINQANPGQMEMESPREPRYDATVGQPVTLQISTSNFFIDPRNKDDQEEPAQLPEYSFRVNLEQPKEIGSVLPSRDLHHDQKQYEEEDEKTRRIREKEEQLRKQEEEIRKEKEKLRREQEEVEREKEEIRRQKLEEEKTKHRQVYDTRSTMNGYDKPSDNVTQYSAPQENNQGPKRLGELWAPDPNKDKQRWSREDMLAMNRKATPLQKKPETETEPETTKEVYHSNSVPKPRTRGGDFSSSQSRSHRSEQHNPHSHWMVEEAERRRKADNKRHSVHGGPIKPVHPEGLANRWRDDTSIPKQQTYTTNSVKSPRSLNTKQFSAEPDRLSQTLPAYYSNSHGSKAENSLRPSRGSPNPQSPSSPPSHAEQIMAVSGKQLCSHCSQELGFGAAMVIESLGLYYHVQCFRCCVCHQALGNGSQGADVRVRVNKLHCRNCYSNDEAGLKFSKV